MEVTLPKEYPLVVLSCVLLCIECFLLGFTVIPARMTAFNKDFMAKFDAEHEKAFPGEKPSVGGWPDDGNGRYSAKLPYKQWFDFNNAMRAHLNMVESMPIILGFILVGGLVLPQYAYITGFCQVVSRIIYSVLYKISGPKGRMAGALLGAVTLYPLGFAAMVQLVRLLL